jgi:hypothetical protein
MVGVARLQKSNEQDPTQKVDFGRKALNLIEIRHIAGLEVRLV